MRRRRRTWIYCGVTPLSLDLHIYATASGVDVNAFLSGGNADYHTGLIRHEGATFPTAKSHPARARGTHIIMTVEILKMLQIENLAVSRRAGNPDFAYRQSAYLHWIVFSLVSERS